MRTYAELYSFPLAPQLLPNERSPKHQLSVSIAAITWLPTVELVLVASQRPGALLLCKMTDNLGGQTQGHPVLATLKTDDAQPIHCVAAVPTALADGSPVVELWTGQSAGYVALFSVEKGGAAPETVSLKRTELINHYEPVVDQVQVQRLLTSPVDPNHVWSYVYPG